MWLIEVYAIAVILSFGVLAVGVAVVAGYAAYRFFYLVWEGCTGRWSQEAKKGVTPSDLEDDIMTTWHP
jgi:hypothetical protein